MFPALLYCKIMWSRHVLARVLWPRLFYIVLTCSWHKHKRLVSISVCNVAEIAGERANPQSALDGTQEDVQWESSS